MTKRVEDMRSLAIIRRQTGVQIRLGFYEELHTIRKSDDQILVSVRTYNVHETKRETRYNGAAWKMYTVTKVNNNLDYWKITDVAVIKDTDFQPYVIRHYGRTETPVETKDRESWEDMCYRPGTEEYPMDNLSVTEDLADIHQDVPKMRKHWRV